MEVPPITIILGRCSYLRGRDIFIVEPATIMFNEKGSPTESEFDELKANVENVAIKHLGLQARD
jgi:hypothetical protein